MSRKYNFSAGPSMLPEAVLKAGARRIAGLAWLWGFDHGDESQRQGICISSRGGGRGCP